MGVKSVCSSTETWEKWGESWAERARYSHLPPGSFASWQHRLRELSPSQNTGCWWRRRQSWWRWRKTEDLFSCSCKVHMKYFPSLPAYLWDCRSAEVRRPRVRMRQRARPRDLMLMICSDWDLTEIDYFQFMLHRRVGASLSLQFSPSALTCRIMSASRPEIWSGSVSWIISLLRSWSAVWCWEVLSFGQN